MTEHGYILLIQFWAMTKAWCDDFSGGFIICKWVNDVN